MPRGGRRNGGGRPKGSKDKRTRKKGVEIAAKKITPLDVMEAAMLAHYQADPPRLDAAASVAKDMAPYVHSKLNTTTLRGGLDVRQRVIEDVVDRDGADGGLQDTPAPPSEGVS